MADAVGKNKTAFCWLKSTAKRLQLLSETEFPLGSTTVNRQDHFYSVGQTGVSSVPRALWEGVGHALHQLWFAGPNIWQQLGFRHPDDMLEMNIVKCAHEQLGMVAERYTHKQKKNY